MPESTLTPAPVRTVAFPGARNSAILSAAAAGAHGIDLRCAAAARAA